MFKLLLQFTKIICIKLKETYFHGVEYFYIYEKLDKSILYLYYYICVMMKLGITEKDCCQDLGPDFINNISNKVSPKIGY